MIHNCTFGILLYLTSLFGTPSFQFLQFDQQIQPQKLAQKQVIIRRSSPRWILTVIIDQSATIYIYQTLNVWYIYLHLPWCTFQINHPCRYTIYPLSVWVWLIYKTGHFPKLWIKFGVSFIVPGELRCWLHSAKTKLVIPSRLGPKRPTKIRRKWGELCHMNGYDITFKNLNEGLAWIFVFKEDLYSAWCLVFCWRFVMTPFTPLAEDQDFDYDLCLQIADRWNLRFPAPKKKRNWMRAQCQGDDMIMSQCQMILGLSIYVTSNFWGGSVECTLNTI